jgi:lysyl oxidase-like protein 2/3/4
MFSTNEKNCYLETELADLLPDPLEVQRTTHLEDRQLWYLQCALEENCLGTKAYQIQVK